MIGRRLGPWLIDAEIGRGAMGSVYRAHRDDDPATVVALKVLNADLARDDVFVARFQREIEALRQLDHPNIVHFLEAGGDDGLFFYAMEFVDGRDCEAILRQRGRLPWPEVLDLALQVVPALKHAHDRGIIHRDLKPANIMLADAKNQPRCQADRFRRRQAVRPAAADGRRQLRRHGRLPRSRASRRQAGQQAKRFLCPRRRPLHAAHRSAAVSRRKRRRVDPQALLRDPRSAADARPGRAASISTAW